MKRKDKDTTGKKYTLVTLGCFRNEVESDILRSELGAIGLREVDHLEEADLVLVNTCGFIAEACEEGIDTILEIDRLLEAGGGGTPIVALGCMGQRYGEKLMQEMPEISAVLGIDWGNDLATAIDAVLEGGTFVQALHAPRAVGRAREVDSSRNASLFVRVSDGCDLSCRFCTIPSIRGTLKSRPPKRILSEVERLAGGRPREVVLVAQDVAAYGDDLAEGIGLLTLIRDISTARDVHWLRLLYLQPEGVDDRLIDEMISNEKICDYFDIPIQHASGHVLRRMGRPGGAGEFESMFNKIREMSPDAALRTTVMVGYPGERESDFRQLMDFVEAVQFDWLGLFIFSPEEGTAAEALGERVSRHVALDRYNALAALQDSIEEARSESFEGRVMEAVIDGESDLEQYEMVGRTRREAPVVDGMVYLERKSPTSREAGPGCFVNVEITGREGLDLVGKI